MSRPCQEKIAEALPAADKARRFRGRAPAVGRVSGREPAGTTVGKNRRSACRGRRPLYSPHGIQNVRGHSIHIAQRVSGGRCARRAHCPQRAASAESGFFLVVSLRGAKPTWQSVSLVPDMQGPPGRGRVVHPLAPPLGELSAQPTEREKCEQIVHTIPKPLRTLSVTFGDSSPGGRAKRVRPAVLGGPLPRRNKKPEADRRSASGGIVECNYFLISPLAAAVR